MYKVYVKTNSAGYITAVNSDAFLLDSVPEGWVQIDEGSDDRHHHAQGNYFPDGLMNDDCSGYRWKMEGGGPVPAGIE